MLTAEPFLDPSWVSAAVSLPGHCQPNVLNLQSCLPRGLKQVVVSWLHADTRIERLEDEQLFLGRDDPVWLRLLRLEDLQRWNHDCRFDCYCLGHLVARIVGVLTKARAKTRKAKMGVVRAGDKLSG